MMSVSKKTLMYLGIGIYIIVVAALGYMVFNQLNEKDSVDEELSITRANLDRITPDHLNNEKLELEAQLTEVTSKAENLKSMLSLDMGNVDATATVFDLAKSSGVEVTQLTSPYPTYDVLEDVPCTVVVLNATVRGDVRDLVGFTMGLNSYLATGVIESVQMNIQEGTDNSTADILFVIYNYQDE
jgi:hypothetical protein